jgi:hypothetical protein
MKKNHTTKSMPYGNSAKFFLLNGKKCVLLQRSNIEGGTRTAGKRSQPFLYPHNINNQVNRLVVCGSGNARKELLSIPEQHHKPFLFNVQKSKAMNAKTQTAGETARKNLIGASYEERKLYMMQCLNESSTAVLVYFDEDCCIRTCGIAERGFESSLLPMLEDAAATARRVAEEVML